MLTILQQAHSIGISNGLGSVQEFNPDNTNIFAVQTAWTYYNLAFQFAVQQRLSKMNTIAPAPTVTPATEPTKGLCVAAPALFDGTRQHFKGSIISLRWNFEAEPTRYNIEF